MGSALGLAGTLAETLPVDVKVVYFGNDATAVSHVCNVVPPFGEPRVLLSCASLETGLESLSKVGFAKLANGLGGGGILFAGLQGKDGLEVFCESGSEAGNRKVRDSALRSVQRLVRLDFGRGRNATSGGRSEGDHFALIACQPMSDGQVRRCRSDMMQACTYLMLL